MSRCRICDSKFHRANRYPNKYSFWLYETRESIFLEESTNSLQAETFNIAITDSGCTKTVCGELWFQYYIDSLSDSDKDKISIDRSNYFKFGNSKFIRSNSLVTIPVFIGSIQAKLIADVIDYEIPLLLSKDSMEKMIKWLCFKKQ